VTPEHPLRWIIGELDREGIEHMLAGSLASTYHGDPRTTNGDVVGILEAREGALDLAYVQRWIDELGLALLWDRARREAGTGA
jgi:hypothetical protein